MAEKESPLKKFTKHVNEYLWVSILCKEDEIRKISCELGNLDEVRQALFEANSLIDFFCEDDEDLYDSLRYRLFYHEDTNKMTIIQGEEIDVDYRGWVEMGGFNEFGEDDVQTGPGRADDQDDEDDEGDPDEDWRA